MYMLLILAVLTICSRISPNHSSSSIEQHSDWSIFLLYGLCIYLLVLEFYLIDLCVQFQHFSQPHVISQLSYILIAAGAFVFVVSFLGYCGAVRESRCLLAFVSLLVYQTFSINSCTFSFLKIIDNSTFDWYKVRIWKA